MKSSTFIGRLPFGVERVAFTVAPLLGVVLWLTRVSVTRVAREQAEQLAFVSAAAVERLVDVFCGTAPLLAVAAVVTLLSRRVAHATITPDHAVIRPLRLPWPVLAIPLVDVIGRRTTPHGVILHAPAAVPRLVSWLLAPLVPATTPVEVARAHGALDAPSLRASEVTASAGRVSGRADLLLLLALVGAGVAAAEAMRPVLGDEVGRVHALGAALLLALLVVTHAARTRAFLGAETLSVGGLCVAWSDVTAIRGEGPWFTLDAGRARRRAARVGAADCARLIAFARERLAQQNREARVLDGAPGWVVRRRAALVVLALGIASAAVVAGPVRYRTAEACLVIVPDEVHHAQWATVVYRKFDGAPQLVVLSEGFRLEAVRGPSRWSERHRAWVDQKSYDVHWRMYAFGRMEIDAQQGSVVPASSLGVEFSIPRGATVVHVTPEGLTASVTPLGPASPRLRALARASAFTTDGGWRTLALCFPGAEDAVLRAALDGVTTARCYEAGVPDGRLLVRVDHGRLASAVIASGFPEQRYQCLSCLVAEGPPRLVRVGGRRTGDGFLSDSDPPSLAEARAALAAVERGASVASATATWPATRGR